ncbi:hypothetical protein [Haloferax sp. DFSO52]|uniref:hypothetical protein n=1 Tax=Haloferax sp. DFSO52 TaxID=3388505 RepID=UPI003A84B375
MFERFESNRYTVRGIVVIGVLFFAILISIVSGDAKLANPSMVLMLVVFGGIFFYLTAGSIYERITDHEQSDEGDGSS